MRGVVQCLLLVLGTVASSSDDCDNEIGNVGTGPKQGKCHCVDWRLCDENGYIITDGSGGLLTPRSPFAPRCGECGKCASAHICCREPPDSEGPSWDKCGVNKYGDSVGTRIMDPDKDSSRTRFAEFPWTLMLLKAQQGRDGKWKKYVFDSGASIIHPNIALTVAHAVHGVNSSLLTVRAGEWNASSNAEQTVHQNRGVRKIIVHPAFNEVHMFNDIALLILDQPFQIAENVAPICLPVPGMQYDPDSCLAVGWGTDRFGVNGRYSTTLRKVHVPIVSDEECEKKLKSTELGQGFQLHYSFMCAGGEQDQDTCVGDGGGPLMCRTDDGSYTQVGIVSWGVKCGNAYPAVYTNVSKFLHWINYILANEGTHSSNEVELLK